MAKKVAKKIDRNAFLISILFVIFCLPIVLSVTRIGQEGTRQFSIYNTDWDGTSELRSTLESNGYEFRPIVSTLNTLTRTEESGVLAIIGPTVFFDPTETAALAYFIAKGGSVLIADDFGSANNILGLINTLLQTFIGQIPDASNLGFLGMKINGSLLMDAQEYHISPVMPVLRTFPGGFGGPDFSSISRVVTSFPSAIYFYGQSEADPDKLIWAPQYVYNHTATITPGCAVSTEDSWMETDKASARNGDFFPDEYEDGGVPFCVMMPIPLASLGVGNLLICSDPSIFVNDLMNIDIFDNRAFATQAFDWLDVNNTGIIYYDESHLSAATGRGILQIFDPFTYVSMYLRFVDSFTMFPLLAPLFPIITLIMLRRNRPKTKKPSPLLMTKIKQQRSRSFFAAKMTWYMNYQQFAKALDLLYKRLVRRLKQKLGLETEIDVEQVINLLGSNFPHQFNMNEVNGTLRRIDEILNKTQKTTEEEFTKLVLELKSIEDIVTKRNL
ncbi:MAG: DUF4350 domain-containing protein [Candidatus Heimdallarchaeota archaeon]